MQIDLEKKGREESVESGKWKVFIKKKSRKNHQKEEKLDERKLQENFYINF
jgi:hypothetical protein